MIIEDNITGEILNISDKYDAIREAKSRVKFHNSEFDYQHRGHHYSQNAYYRIVNNKIIIERMPK